MKKVLCGAILYEVTIFGPVAQWIEQLPSKQWVVGSIPARATKKITASRFRLAYFFGSPGMAYVEVASLRFGIRRLCRLPDLRPGLW